MRPLTALLVVALAALPALAEGKKDTKSDSAVDAFFAPAPAKKSALDDLHKATEGLAHKEKNGGMAPKGAAVDDEAEVKVHAAFAAETIVIDKKQGCQPGGKRRERLAFWAFEELPETGVPFQVCLNVSSKAGRQMSLSVAIVDPRNLRIARAEDVVDFSGRTGRIDHVLEFPSTTFKTVGPYLYLVEMDGKEIARMPIFEVRLVPPGGAASAP
jgi:hypothetical protein